MCSLADGRRNRASDRRPRMGCRALFLIRVTDCRRCSRGLFSEVDWAAAKGSPGAEPHVSARFQPLLDEGFGAFFGGADPPNGDAAVLEKTARLQISRPIVFRHASV
jgi:hypothetical protein